MRRRPGLTLDERSLAVNMLIRGKTIQEVTQHFKLSENSISRLRQKYPELATSKTCHALADLSKCDTGTITLWHLHRAIVF